MKGINTILADRTTRMPKCKGVLTTGQVSKICNVAPRTVCKWFDSGQLRGYRVPSSRSRRIPVPELIRFMKAHNMPTERLYIELSEQGNMALVEVE